MRLTAREIRQSQFSTRFRGYDQEEVETFLQLVAADMEELLREHERLREELKAKTKELERHRAEEAPLKKSLLALQEMREELMAKAKGEVDRTRQEAQQIRERALREADEASAGLRRQQDELKREIEGLSRQKQLFIEELRSLLEEQLRLLEEAEAQPAPDRASGGGEGKNTGQVLDYEAPEEEA